MYSTLQIAKLNIKILRTDQYVNLALNNNLKLSCGGNKILEKVIMKALLIKPDGLCLATNLKEAWLVGVQGNTPFV